ncbi:MAG TPA: sigma-70 family RNA polymerase sigma factor [Herpetosiphonaceae bacterium]
MAQVQQRPEEATSDQQLITRVAQQDRRAFEILYDRYAPAVFGLALKTLGDRQIAEEAVQEVFWRVWQRAASFDPNRMFAPWLFGIAHNYCIDELRRRRARPQPVYEDDEHPVLSSIADTTDVSEAALQSEQRRIVADALQQLPNEQRQALELAYYGGLTQQEIATRLGNPLGTIKTRMRLGLQKLRGILQDQGLVE